MSAATRSACIVVSCLTLSTLSTPSHADGFMDPIYGGFHYGVVQLEALSPFPDFTPSPEVVPPRSRYFQWQLESAVAGRAAPIAISNEPCYVYRGAQLVVLPCPGTEPVAVAYGGEPYYGERRAYRHRYWAHRRYYRHVIRERY
jgi:hypothetical protein